MSIFPDEIVVQILARLPIKSLIRAKSVCKLWYKLCSDKYLVKLFNEMSLRNRMVFVEVSDSSPESKHRLICIDYMRGVSEFSLGFLGERVRVRASCNGLLCCVSVADLGVYYVCNPMTREFKLLPSCSDRAVTRFYPYTEATLVGLACDTVKHSYSVVLAGYHRSFCRRPENTFMCKVYNSESGKWRKFASLQDASFTHMSKIQVVFINGMLHWLAACYSFVLLMDLSCDVWKKILLPLELSHESGTRVYLLQLDESLSVIQISDSWMNIWVLSNYENQEWTMVGQVSLRCIRVMVPEIFPVSQTATCVYFATHKQILVYNRKTRVWKEMFSVKNGSSLPLWYSAQAFQSTMFPC
ncbi:hypothetical protein QQ045_009091 [Rhodiola kirilowii]